MKDYLNLELKDDDILFLSDIVFYYCILFLYILFKTAIAVLRTIYDIKVNNNFKIGVDRGGLIGGEIFCLNDYY